MKKPLFIFLSLTLGIVSTLGAKDQLNVLFIVADDLNVDIAAYGHRTVKTPNLDKLRKRSMIFDRAYAQYPICNPSRNSFLSGQYPGTNGCLSNKTNIRDTAPDAMMLPQHFKENGYRVISTGKIYHSMDPVSWTHISDERTGGLMELGKKPSYYRGAYQEHLTKGEGRLIVDDTVKWFRWRSVDEGEEYLKDHWVTQATLKRIDEVAESKEPFFLGVGYHRPHDPFIAPKRFFDMYPLNKLRLPKTPDDASPVPDYAFNITFKRAFDKMSKQDKLEAMRAFYAGISYMDEQLGIVMDYMDEKDLLDNTVIVFLGDHGYQVGEKDYWNKALLFERSCRTPLMISVPDMNYAGVNCWKVVELIDIYPTLTELCNLSTPKGIEGKSLVPLLNDPANEFKELAFSYCNKDRSVRTDRYRYIKWSGGSEGLYDHRDDPAEHYNLVEKKQYLAILEEMRALVSGMPELDKN